MLIVDDIPANLKVLREVLEPRGFRILLAPRGEVALKIARSEIPDLILLDVMMPEMDGFEVCRRLKNDSVTANIPVMFITAKDESEDIVKGLSVGGMDYVSKPFQAEVVVARSETHLKNSLMARALQRNNEELAIAKDAAERARSAQSTFLATMSHEIRTPMNSVLGMTALLLETPLAHEQRDFVETIRTSSRSLLGIINEILDFSKIESGKMTLESQPFNLDSSIEEILDILGSRAAEKNLDFAYLPEPGLPSTVVGDITRFKQILLNLAGNALKFTARGEVVITAQRLSSEGTGADASIIPLHFSVRDTGIGIPREKQARLFQAFTQVDSSTTRQYGGTGLGLAISKRLTELMGGKMWIESEPSVGCTFHFTVPFGIAREESDTEISALLPLAGSRVLIVEDNPSNGEVLNRHLGAWKLKPQCVATAAEALDHLKNNRPDLVILDLQLPDCDGFELASAIRRLPSGKSLPLVFLSSRPQRMNDSRLANLEIRAVISKPIRTLQLRNALNRVVHPETVSIEAPSDRAFDVTLADRLPLRILIADDHELNQKVGSRILQGFGYRCEIAGNGLEVIQALKRQSFDIVFLDIQMPEMDGYETARQIRACWQEDTRPRLIAMTANALRGDREKCLEAGMDDFIAKPVEIAEIRRALETWGKINPNSNAGTSSLGISPKQSIAFNQASTIAVVEGPIDWSRLEQLTGGNPDLTRELIALYFQKTAEQIEQLEEALKSADPIQVEMLAHKCKGASATCGIEVVTRPMTELEATARSGDLSNAGKHLAEASEAFARLRESFANRV